MPASARDRGARLALPVRVTRRILVVDDEPPILAAMGTYFRREGYQVDCAGEREEAEALLVTREYACVIVDLRLTAAHGADGLEVVSFARDRCPWSRIIVLTAHGSAATEVEARRLGADVFLHKPKPLPDLAQIVSGLLGEPA